MKAAFKVALAASLAVGATAQPHNHHHQHARKHQRMGAREVMTNYEFSTDTVYVDTDGSSIVDSDALQGLEDGTYKIVGESTPESVTPIQAYTPIPTPTPSTSSSSTITTSVATPTTSAPGGAFVEINNKIGLGAHSSSSSSSTVVSETSSAPASYPTTDSSGDTGIDVDFPDGEISCNDFASVAKYGAIELSNTPASPWAGLMYVGLDAYTLGQSALITVDIVEPATSDPEAGTFVTYACEAGYEAAQWPEAQGSTGQSIGGLWCDKDYKLYLTRSATTSKLCQAGAGNVHVVSKLSKPVYICKTVYPGSEAMYLPTRVSPGETVDLYNPLQSESYEWQGSSTSAQYYLNMQDVPIDQACTWSPSSPYSKVAGNWAGMNLGTSVNAEGNTFLSIFHNTPTSNAPLDYNIEVAGTADGGEGEVNGLPCAYDYSSNAVTGGLNGCTVSAAGADIYVIFSD